MAETRPRFVPTKQMRPSDVSVALGDTDELTIKRALLHRQKDEEHEMLLGAYEVLRENERHFREMIVALTAEETGERKRGVVALLQSEERYRALFDTLDAEVRRRREELERRNTEMLEQAGQLRTLSTRLIQIQDDERRRIARELHDSVGQDLAALSMCLEETKRSATTMPQTAVRKLDESCEIVKKCSEEIRTLSHLLHPPLLEELGLASAIKCYVEGFASRSRIDVNLEILPNFKRLDSSIELSLFRVLQECLTNIHRHSESKTARVKVETDGRKVSLEISDQGKGIAKGERNRSGVGISGMRERLSNLGGTLEIHSTNQGTTVRAEIPLCADGRATAQIISRSRTR